MTQNGVQVVDVDKAQANAQAPESDNTHLIVELTQESYDVIKDVVDRATARGLDSTFDHWLNDAIKTGARARVRTWDDRDYVTLFKQATSPNAIIANAAKAKLAKLLKMDVGGTNVAL
jgi:predicted ATPase